MKRGNRAFFSFVSLTISGFLCAGAGGVEVAPTHRVNGPNILKPMLRKVGEILDRNLR